MSFGLDCLYVSVWMLKRFVVILVYEFLQVQEVFNFSQDDLLTEDVLILDTHAEVFVWIGQLVDAKEKQNAFEIGQSYIELAASLEGLPPQVPLYKVTEGTEPTFFTTYFSWDNTKAIVCAAILLSVSQYTSCFF